MNKLAIITYYSFISGNIAGSILILSSLLKSVNIHSFAMETGDYIDLYMPSWLHGFKYPCAMLVCQIELMLGLLGLRTKYRTVVLCGMLVMLTFFVWLTAVNAFFPTILGSIESCGCFGELIHFTPMASFVKSVVLWLMVGDVLLIEFNHNDNHNHEILSLKQGRWRGPNIPQDCYFWVSVSAGWCLVLFSYFYVNRLSHDLYLAIYIGICVVLAIVAIWCGKKC
ncbi:MAG: hypothetical protein PUC18_03125 [Prevotellaceae bacterium]|nr:hypothetical protein [Prevotellaceae bacterium]